MIMSRRNMESTNTSVTIAEVVGLIDSKAILTGVAIQVPISTKLMKMSQMNTNLS